jgi:carboxyl-terminal processing protease
MRKILLYMSLISLISCDKAFIGSDPENEEIECFNLLWSNYDLHYPSFKLKNINWDSVKNIEGSKVNKIGLYKVLVNVGMILNDGHFEVKTSNGAYIYSPFPWVNRVTNSPINISRYVSLHSIYSNIIQFGYYKNIGYISIRNFGLDVQYYNTVSDVISQFKDKDGIIIDIRNNPGGNSSNGDLIAGRFTDKKVLTFKFRYRNGSNHSDFRTDIEHYVNPTGDFQFKKPVVVLINKRCGSASEMFCLNMRVLPKAFLVGDTTSGTTTDNTFQELPNGWIYRIALAYTITPQNEIFEGKGIPPTYPIWISKQDSINGKDLIFEKAVDLIMSKK